MIRMSDGPEEEMTIVPITWEQLLTMDDISVDVKRKVLKDYVKDIEYEENDLYSSTQELMDLIDSADIENGGLEDIISKLSSASSFNPSKGIDWEKTDKMLMNAVPMTADNVGSNLSKHQRAIIRSEYKFGLLTSDDSFSFSSLLDAPGAKSAIIISERLFSVSDHSRGYESGDTLNPTYFVKSGKDIISKVKKEVFTYGMNSQFDLIKFQEAVDSVGSVRFSDLDQSAKSGGAIRVIDITHSDFNPKVLRDEDVPAEQAELDRLEYQGMVTIDPNSIAVGKVTNRGITFDRRWIGDVVFNERVDSDSPYFRKYLPQPTLAYNWWRMFTSAPTIKEAKRKRVMGVNIRQLNFTAIYHSPLLGSRSAYGLQWFNKKLSALVLKALRTRDASSFPPRESYVHEKSDTDKVVNVVPLLGLRMAWEHLSNKLKSEALCSNYYASALDIEMGTFQYQLYDAEATPVYYVTIPPGFGKSSVMKAIEEDKDGKYKDAIIIDVDTVSSIAEVKPWNMTNKEYRRGIIDRIKFVLQQKSTRERGVYNIPTSPMLFLLHNEQELPTLRDLKGLPIRFVDAGYLVPTPMFGAQVIEARSEKVLSMGWFWNMSQVDRHRLAWRIEDVCQVATRLTTVIKDGVVRDSVGRSAKANRKSKLVGLIERGWLKRPPIDPRLGEYFNSLGNPGKITKGSDNPKQVMKDYFNRQNCFFLTQLFDIYPISEDYSWDVPLREMEKMSEKYGWGTNRVGHMALIMEYYQMRLPYYLYSAVRTFYSFNPIVRTRIISAFATDWTITNMIANDSSYDGHKYRDYVKEAGPNTKKYQAVIDEFKLGNINLSWYTPDSYAVKAWWDWESSDPQTSFARSAKANQTSVSPKPLPRNDHCNTPILQHNWILVDPSMPLYQRSDRRAKDNESSMSMRVSFALTMVLSHNGGEFVTVEPNGKNVAQGIPIWGWMNDKNMTAAIATAATSLMEKDKLNLAEPALNEEEWSLYTKWGSMEAEKHIASNHTVRSPISEFPVASQADVRKAVLETYLKCKEHYDSLVGKFGNAMQYIVTTDIQRATKGEGEGKGFSPRTFFKNKPIEVNKGDRMLYAFAKLQKNFQWRPSHAITLKLGIPKTGDTVFYPASRTDLYRPNAVYYANVNTAAGNASAFTTKRTLDAVLQKLLQKAKGVDVSGHFYPLTLLPISHYACNMVATVLNLSHLYHAGWSYKWSGQPLKWHTEIDYQEALRLVIDNYTGSEGTLKVTARRRELMDLFIKIVPEYAAIFANEERKGPVVDLNEPLSKMFNHMLNEH